MRRPLNCVTIGVLPWGALSDAEARRLVCHFNFSNLYLSFVLECFYLITRISSTEYDSLSFDYSMFEIHRLAEKQKGLTRMAFRSRRYVRTCCLWTTDAIDTLQATSTFSRHSSGNLSISEVPRAHFVLFSSCYREPRAVRLLQRTRNFLRAH